MNSQNSRHGGTKPNMQSKFYSSPHFQTNSSKNSNTLRLVAIAGFIAMTGSTLSLIAVTVNAIIAYFAYKKSFGGDGLKSRISLFKRHSI